VVFTDPEIAWCGLTETEAQSKNQRVQVTKFPWAASGRAQTLGRPDGVTKLILDPDTEQVLGMGISGVGAGELIGEGVLAVDNGLKAKDLARSIHPHPTLSETIMESAEVFYGEATHIYKRPRK
jgi:dihydrolipoamide dehydrogenase